ncbi:12441_t:CDS:1, partial [Cetraspora pellucida]
MAERLAIKTASKLKKKDLAARNQLGQAIKHVSYVEYRLKAEVYKKEA